MIKDTFRSSEYSIFILPRLILPVGRHERHFPTLDERPINEQATGWKRITFLPDIKETHLSRDRLPLPLLLLLLE